MNENILLVGLFVAVLLIAFVVIDFFARRREVNKAIRATRQRRSETDAVIDDILGSENEELRYYLDVVKNSGRDSLEMRLVRAGYFSKGAVWRFGILRFLVCAMAFSAVQFGVGAIFNQVNNAMLLIIAALVAGVAFIVCSWILEAVGNKRSREFRKLFPDFMDLLLVCVDSGLGIESAIDRVTREFLLSTRDFGLQLSIVNLEVRAGRPLHEALQNFSVRTSLDEARTLAVLFRQSQELGSSVARTLRTFSAEMRQTRLIKAEEKANALPVKMLFPMAVFMFPVNLIIVLVPILIAIIKMLVTMMPS